MAIHQLTFALPNGDIVTADINRTLAAGFTHRDRAIIDAHIAELEEIGVAPPPHIPLLFPVLPTLLTNSQDIAVLGDDTTPEIEFALFQSQGEIYVTVASDQTDRKMEADDIVVSKNICPKILGKAAWRLSDVRRHWDDIQLRSYSNGTLLQEGTLGMIRPPEDLMAFIAKHDGPEHEGRLILSGTVPTLATPSDAGAAIDLHMINPHTGQEIQHSYKVHPLKPDMRGGD